ncbi:hypothetical protein [Microbacterium sp. Clip185]|uniref:hypothetical protein n=1 Tax=Microbacterium sp. Clip185 TaxID=3025663 RepID=UPI0023658970|nr:hypothetical protein [Microbacterium sp. Clip185]WDG19481.1 hypothetical protein PQV94_07015 [Microbacterium sp. Clip185]
MTTVIPSDQGTFDSLVKGVTDGIDDMRENLDECVETFNRKKDDISLWEKFMEWFMDRMGEVRDKLQIAVEKFGEFLATIADYLSPGNPFAMYAKQDEWILVKQKISGSRTTITADYLKADTSWKGDPGDGYGALAGRQSTAMETVVGYVDGMIDFLSDYAQKILNTWIDFAKRIATYVLDQINAGASFITADPLEWLDAVPKIVTVCTNLAQLGVDAVASFGTNFTDSKAKADQLKQEMANLYGFPNGSWPAATLG